MKYIYKIIFIFIIVSSCYVPNGPKSSFHETKKLDGLCKLWGFLKYYHPLVGSGKIDWDSVLLVNTNYLLKPTTKSEYNKILVSIIPEIIYHDSNIICENPFLLNYNLEFLMDSNLFSSEIIEKCNKIIANKRSYKNFYVEQNVYSENPLLVNDSAYFSNESLSTDIKLLSLFRLWNIINYFYPYKYLIDSNWNNILPQYISKFIKSENNLDYYLLVRNFLSNINDNHVFVTNKITHDYFGQFELPFDLVSLNGNYYIKNLFIIDGYDSLRVGDMIISLDGKKIKEIENNYKSIISASNEVSLKNKTSLYLCRSKDSVVTIQVLRKNNILSYKVKAYKRKKLKEIKNKYLSRNYTQVIDNHISYVNLEHIQYHEMDSVLKPLYNSKVIIFDLRNNCNFMIDELSSFLFSDPVYFYDYLVPNYNLPGIFSIKSDDFATPTKNNTKTYNGRIIVLINGNTQSIGEFTTMLIENYDSCTLIGSSTAGTDGNVSIAYLPGKLKIYFSGLGIYYPGFINLQRVGIKPDIEIIPTPLSIIDKKDVVLSFAINKAKEYIN